VLADDGALYLGLGNKYGIMEPHYKLPLLSYLPAGMADRYIKASGRAGQYYERFRGRSGLRRMLVGFHIDGSARLAEANGPDELRRARSSQLRSGHGHGTGRTRNDPVSAARRSGVRQRTEPCVRRATAGLPAAPPAPGSQFLFSDLAMFGLPPSVPRSSSCMVRPSVTRRSRRDLRRLRKSVTRVDPAPPSGPHTSKPCCPVDRADYPNSTSLVKVEFG
jgi:hypothetical protein